MDNFLTKSILLNCYVKVCGSCALYNNEDIGERSKVTSDTFQPFNKYNSGVYFLEGKGKVSKTSYGVYTSIVITIHVVISFCVLLVSYVEVHMTVVKS